MTKHNIAITLLIALGVTACSGGSSSSHTETTRTEVPSTIISGGTVTITEGDRSNNAAPSDESGSTNVNENTNSNVADNGTAITDNSNTGNVENANTNNSNSGNTENTNADNGNSGNTENTNADNGNQNETAPSAETNASNDENPVTDTNDNNTGHNSVYFKDDAKYVSATWHTSPEGIMYADHWNTDNADGYNQIKIGDTWIDLFPAGVQSKALNQESAQQIKYLTRGDYTLSGIAQFNDIEGQPFYVISQGKNPTQDMPTAGTFLYQGKGQHAELENNNLDFNRSDLTFEADFANKSLTGTVSSPDNIFPTRNLKADMTKQNAFSGVSDGIELSGGFYGSNAAEMTGQYHRNIETENGKEIIMGVFNATKQ